MQSIAAASSSLTFAPLLLRGEGEGIRLGASNVVLDGKVLGSHAHGGLGQLVS